jgi:hypothetical protein
MEYYIYIPLWIFHIPSYSIIFHNYILNIMDTHSSYPLLISMVTWSGLCWRRSSGLSGLSVGVTSAAVAVAVKARVRRRATKGAAREELGHLQTIIWNVYIYIYNMYNIYIYIYIFVQLWNIMNTYIYIYKYAQAHTYVYIYIHIHIHVPRTWMDAWAKVCNYLRRFHPTTPKKQQEGQDQLGAGDEIKFATSNESKAAETSPTFRILHNSPIKCIM